MPTTYERCGSEVESLAKKTMRAYHPELVEVGTKVAYLFARAQKDEHGKPLSPAVTVGGYPCAAKVKVIPLLQRADGRADAEIIIDEDEWKERSDAQREALLDHELHHLEVQRDSETGAPKGDDLGRPKFKLRKHDHQHGWFDAIARRHGDSSYEVQQAKAFADEFGQTYFGWSKPPEREVESLRIGEANPAPAPATGGATAGAENVKKGTGFITDLITNPVSESKTPIEAKSTPVLNQSEIIHIDIPWADSEDVATFATTQENGQFGYETRAVLGIAEKKFCNRNGYGSRKEAIAAGVAQMRTHLKARIGNASGAVLNHAREFDEKLAGLPTTKGE